jgi:hypothetical protein
MDMMAVGLVANAFLVNPAHLLFLKENYNTSLFPSPR